MEALSLLLERVAILSSSYLQKNLSEEGDVFGFDAFSSFSLVFFSERAIFVLVRRSLIRYKVPSIGLWLWEAVVRYHRLHQLLSPGSDSFYSITSPALFRSLFSGFVFDRRFMCFLRSSDSWANLPMSLSFPSAGLFHPQANSYQQGCLIVNSGK